MSDCGYITATNMDSQKRFSGYHNLTGYQEKFDIDDRYEVGFFLYWKTLAA